MDNGKNDKDVAGVFSEDEQIQRLAAMGELLADMVHEINNLMTGVLGFAALEALRAREAESHYNLSQVTQCATAVRDLTRNLLRIARSPDRDGHGDVAAAVETTLNMFRRRAESRKIFLESALPANVPAVALATGDLRLVLANLIKNALDAVEDQAERHIRVAARSTPQGLEINVWNSGRPISPEHMPRIFDPFFTTKTEERGTGLGLSISRRLVAQAGGELTAVHPQHGGVTFRLSMPLTDRVQKSAPAREDVPPVILKGCRVLVVDDEYTAREVLGLMVSRTGGATVDTCASGEEALTRLINKNFDVVVLDLRMAKLSGQDVYRCLPDNMKKRVVFVTGDTLRLSTRRFLEKTKQPILFKPVACEDLLEAVNGVRAA